MFSNAETEIMLASQLLSHSYSRVIPKAQLMWRIGTTQGTLAVSICAVDKSCQQPSHGEHTNSHSIYEMKQHRARIVLR